MTAAAVLIAASVFLIAIALREFGAAEGGSGRRGEPADRSSRGLMARLSAVMPDGETRIERAGRPGGLTASGLAVLRILGAGSGAVAGLTVMSLMPGRLGSSVPVLAVAFGLIAPDMVLERMTRRRRGEIVEALPDSLEVLAVGLGGGRSVRAGVSELAEAGGGVLARELRVAAAEIECGRRPAEAMVSLRGRAPGPELRTVTLTIERSARLGSPLVDELHRLAGSIRDGRRRQMTEKASRAAPKMQLVIAMVLVPSVLLLVAAGLIANAGDLLSGL